MGKTISYDDPADLEVIGLVKDHRARTPGEAAEPMTYLPYLQRYQAILTLVALAHTEATGVAAIREAAKSLHPAVAQIRRSIAGDGKGERARRGAPRNGAVALAAAWLPARRAARVDPMIALRVE